MTPAATPVTTPAVETVAMAVLALTHVPPVMASESVVLLPAHTLVVPVMVPADGDELTVTTFVVAKVPQLLLTA